MSATYAPTEQQQQAREARKSGGNVVITAYAGTGKTSTLRMLGDDMKAENTKAVFIAYNKSIATDAAASFPSNVTCRTAHSFAFGAVGKNFKDRLDQPRQQARETARILGIKNTLQFIEDLSLAAWAQARHVMETVQKFCYSADTHVKREHVPFIPGADMQLLCDVIVPKAQAAWEDLILKSGYKLSWNGSHDIYLKMWALSNPSLPGEVVMLDEAQDSNPCVAGVVTQQDAQQIMVGDRNQQIYAWRGAVDAMDKFPADHRVALTKSFRFGEAIAAEANIWLDMLENDLPLEGFDQVPSRIGPVAMPDAVLCRTNARVIEEAIMAAERDQRYAIVGGTADIRRFAESANDLQTGRGASHPELVAFQTWAQAQQFAQEEGEGSFKVMVKLVDAHGPQRIMDIASQATTEYKADVILSTAHRSKGREWDSVKVANDFSEPEEGQLPSRADMMLAYVTVTRAKLNLDMSGLDWVHGL